MFLRAVRPSPRIQFPTCSKMRSQSEGEGEGEWGLLEIARNAPTPVSIGLGMGDGQRIQGEERFSRPYVAMYSAYHARGICPLPLAATRSAFVPRFIRLYQRCGHLSCARCCLQCVGATPLVLIPTMDVRLSGET
jgi:hypothetical protein